MFGLVVLLHVTAIRRRWKQRFSCPLSVTTPWPWTSALSSCPSCTLVEPLSGTPNELRGSGVVIERCVRR